MKVILIFVFALMATLPGHTQDPKSSWTFTADANSYFFTDQFIFLPVFKADKEKLHLEGRYNYEDLHTVSAWAGYNFSGGKKIEYTITPMLGGVTGNTKGVATGLEFTFTKNKFEIYSESEYLIDADAIENNFLYNWTDLTYSINDYWWVGLSAQRTRLYQTKLDLQRGLLVGAAWKKFEVTGYVYNIGFDTAFTLLTLTANF